MTKPTFTLYANSGGCPQNQLDGTHTFDYLVSNGYEYSDSIETADVIVINSCAYTTFKEDQSYDVVQDACIRSKPDARIILSGCLPRIAPGRVQFLDPKVAVVAGLEPEAIQAVIPRRTAAAPAEVNFIAAPALRYVKRFREAVRSTMNRCRSLLPYEAALHFDRLFMYDHSPQTFIIRAARGCLGGCTYCAIRFSRGKLRSKPLPAILEEVRRAVRLGVREIMLTGTDLAAYGRDQNSDFAALLQAVLEAAPDQRLLLFYANPRWMIDIWERLEPAFATQRIHFVHLALNGGSDRVLARMKRGYTLSQFETLFRSIRRVSPGTVLQTQVITGFPGETESDFQETVGFLKRNQFHNVQVHAFDPRPGTLAERMDGEVPYALRQKRRKCIYAMTLLAKLRFNVRYVLHGFREPAFGKR